MGYYDVKVDKYCVKRLALELNCIMQLKPRINIHATVFDIRNFKNMKNGRPEIIVGMRSQCLHAAGMLDIRGGEYDLLNDESKETLKSLGWSVVCKVRKEKETEMRKARDVKPVKVRRLPGETKSTKKPGKRLSDVPNVTALSKRVTGRERIPVNQFGHRVGSVNDFIDKCFLKGMTRERMLNTIIAKYPGVIRQHRLIQWYASRRYFLQHGFPVKKEVNGKGEVTYRVNPVNVKDSK